MATAASSDVIGNGRCSPNVSRQDDASAINVLASNIAAFPHPTRLSAYESPVAVVAEKTHEVFGEAAASDAAAA